MKVLTAPTTCATCGGGLHSELVAQNAHETEWAYKVTCLNADCPQFEQDGFVRAVETPAA